MIQYAIGKNATEFTIPKGVTSIGNSAFNKCTLLTSVVIPNSVTNIGNFAFYNCKNLKIINYNDIKEKWDNINKGYMWSVGLPISKIICNDGVIGL